MEKRFTVRMPSELDKRLALKAKKSYISKSDVVRQAVAQYLNE